MMTPPPTRPLPAALATLSPQAALELFRRVILGKGL